jgi:uncharacterized membrane protein YfcA
VSHESENGETPPVGMPAETPSAEPEGQRKKYFWPLMVAIVIGSAPLAILIAHLGFRGQSRLLVAAIWYVLVLVGYRLVRDRE